MNAGITASIMLTAVICVIITPVDASGQEDGGDVKCSISMSVRTYQSEWNGVDRKSADGRYYPGDGFNYIAKWTRDDTCRGFKIFNPNSYGNAVVASEQHVRGVNATIPGLPDGLRAVSQHHFERAFEEDEDRDMEFVWKNAGTPSIWNVWAEDDESKDEFWEDVKQRCTFQEREGKIEGCIFGHVELDTTYRGDVCHEDVDRDGETVTICREVVPRVEFKAEGQGKRCRDTDEGRKCTTFTRTVTRGTNAAVRQPTLDLILERSPFHDIHGFKAVNQDGTFYIHDLMGIGYAPNMTYTRGGALQFVVDVERRVPEGTIPQCLLLRISCDDWLKPDVRLWCMEDASCDVWHSHQRTDSRNYTIPHGHGKHGILETSIGNYSFTYEMKVYNLGWLGHRSTENHDDLDWTERRLLNKTSGEITIYAGPYDPVATLYSHSIWNASGLITPDSQTGITVNYAGSVEDDTTYPERRMRIDGTYGATIAYNSTHALLDDGTVEPYEPFFVPPDIWWAGFDSHSGNHTTVGNRTMMESAGYGTVRLFTNGTSGTMLDRNAMTGIVNATGHFFQYTNFLGGIHTTWINGTTYTYPSGYHAIPLNVTAYSSDGTIKPVNIEIAIVPSDDSHRTFKQYIETKVMEEQDDETVGDIVSSYANTNHTLSGIGQIISHIPRITHVYTSDTYKPNGTSLENSPDYESIENYVLLTPGANSSAGGLADWLPDIDPGIGGLQLLPGTEQLDSWLRIVGRVVQDSRSGEDLPLHIGLESGTSPANITITADGTTRSWNFSETFHSEPMTIIINADHDNPAEFKRPEGALSMRVPAYFGTVTSLDDGRMNKTVFCTVGCIIGEISPGVNITAHNMWNGTATATYEPEEPDDMPRLDPDRPPREIFPRDEITLTALVLITAFIIYTKLSSGHWSPFHKTK